MASQSVDPCQQLLSVQIPPAYQYLQKVGKSVTAEHDVFAEWPAKSCLSHKGLPLRRNGFEASLNRICLTETAMWASVNMLPL